MSCVRDYRGDKVPSDSGKYELWTTINRTSSDESDYGLVMVHVQGKDWKKPVTLDTRAGDAMQWHVGWGNGDTIVLWSSDIGNRAWVVREKDVVDIPMTSSLNEQADWLKGP